ncbi:MAG: PIN domain-containing protein [Nitrososphaerota archaeon]|nr:PIN domain-containing protein [Nitrososphaerota archaeon]
MTLIGDTRFLLVYTFPADEEERDRVRELMHRSLRERLVIPSVVLTEYFKTAGRRIGKEGVSTRISSLKESGAEISELDEDTALLAGRLLLKDEKRFVGDALIAATALSMRASHIISDDPHFHQFGLKTKWL